MINWKFYLLNVMTLTVVLILSTNTNAQRLMSPDRAFTQLEETLLSAETIRMEFEITSTGAFESDLRGEVLLKSGNQVFIEASGTFGPDSVALHLVSNGEHMKGGNGDKIFAEEMPEQLNEAVIVGLTRMGLLHNLARLTGAAPPDHADGTVRDWVQVTDVAYGTIENGQFGTLNPREYNFNIIVTEQPSGAAVLTLDEENFLPLERQQTVKFGDKEMEVVEKYTVFEIDGELEDAQFQLKETK